MGKAFARLGLDLRPLGMKRGNDPSSPPVAPTAIASGRPGESEFALGPDVIVYWEHGKH